MKKHLLLISVLLFVCTALFAQGDFKLSEQMFSRINQNPAAIGNNEKIQIFTAGRMQYVGMGLEQTPTSALLNGHYYNENLKSGFGLSFSYDELGLYNQTINAKICYAYNLDLFEGGLLSLGLSAGVVNKMFDPARHVWRDGGDPLDGAEKTNTTAFDLDFGFEFSYKYLLVGASITHLPSIASDVRTTAAPSHINAYVSIGCFIDQVMYRITRLIPMMPDLPSGQPVAMRRTRHPMMLAPASGWLNCFPICSGPWRPEPMKATAVIVCIVTGRSVGHPIAIKAI